MGRPLAEIRREFRRVSNLVHHEDHFGKRRALLNELERLYTEAVGQAEKADQDIAEHPGRYLHSRYMVPRDLTAKDVAQRIGMAEGRVQQLVNGKRQLDPDVAIRLGLLTSTPARMWMRMQAAWDLQEAMTRAASLKTAVRPLEP
jgi:addiction module HigA family antidote